MTQSELNRYDSIFMLRRGIYVNTYKPVWEELLKEKGLHKQYKNTHGEILDFINECVLQREILPQEINEVLIQEITYGKHKFIQMYHIDSNTDINEDDILRGIGSKYPNINEIEFNQLAYLYALNDNEPISNIAYLSVLEKLDTGKIKKLRIVFVKTINYKKEDKTCYENSYFPMDIDFERGVILTKYYDKGYAQGEQRGEVIAQKYTEQVMGILNLNYSNSKQTMYQGALYSICKHILDGVITEKSKLIVENIDEIVEECAKNIEDSLKPAIDAEALLKKHKKNIFNTKEQVNKMIENIIISKIIFETSPKEYTSLEGLISYLTYKEKGMMRTTLKNPKKDENILDSQSYLNLRMALEETKYIETIKMMWKKEEKMLSIKYDASKWKFICIKFYRRYEEGDLVYALQRLYEFI